MQMVATKAATQTGAAKAAMQVAASEAAMWAVALVTWTRAAALRRGDACGGWETVEDPRCTGAGDPSSASGYATADESLATGSNYGSTVSTESNGPSFPYQSLAALHTDYTDKYI